MLICIICLLQTKGEKGLIDQGSRNMKSSRISRVVQILTTLRAGENCTVDDLAKTFGTSRRTIFRDLKELQLIGVPQTFSSNLRPKEHKQAGGTQANSKKDRKSPA